MAVISKLSVALEMDSSKFGSEITKAEGMLDRFKGKVDSVSASMRSMGTKATTFISAPIAAGFVKAISSASDLNETVSKTNQVFGSSADAVMKWSETSATAFGLSKQQALDTVSTYGAMATSAGLSGDAAVKFGEDLVGAAADLGSFWNFDPSQVAADIQSGLAGESEPLRKYNIYLTEASVNAKAMEMGLVDANGEVSEQNKVLARQALIMEQLGPAAGDFAKTQGGLANSTRILKAQFADIVAQMGLYLLPFMTKLAAQAKALLAQFDKLTDSQKKMILLFLGVAAAIGPLLLALGFIAPALALISAPILLLIAAIALLALAWINNWGDIQGKTAAVIKYLRPLFDYLIDVLTNKIQPRDLDKVPKSLQPIALVLGRIVKTLRVFFKTWSDKGFMAALRTLPAQIRAFGRAFAELFEGKGFTHFADAIRHTFNDISQNFGAFVDLIDDLVHGRWSQIWGDLYRLTKSYIMLMIDQVRLSMGLVQDAFNAINWSAVGTALGNGVIAAVTYMATVGVPWAVTKGTELISSLFGAMMTYWTDTAAPWIAGLPSALFGLLVSDDTFSLLYSAGNFLIDGLSQAIMAGWNWLSKWFATIPAALAGVFNGIFWPFYAIGQALMQGLIQGISSLWSALSSWVTQIINLLASVPWDLVNRIFGGLSGGPSSASSGLTGGNPTVSSMPAVSSAGANQMGGTFNITNNINGAGDADTVAELVVRKTMRAIRRQEAGLAT